MTSAAQVTLNSDPASTAEAVSPPWSASYDSPKPTGAAAAAEAEANRSESPFPPFPVCRAAAAQPVGRAAFTSTSAPVLAFSLIPASANALPCKEASASASSAPDTLCGASVRRCLLFGFRGLRVLPLLLLLMLLLILLLGAWSLSPAADGSLPSPSEPMRAPAPISCSDAASGESARARAPPAAFEAEAPSLPEPKPAPHAPAACGDPAPPRCHAPEALVTPGTSDGKPSSSSPSFVYPVALDSDPLDGDSARALPTPPPTYVDGGTAAASSSSSFSTAADAARQASAMSPPA